MQWLPPSTTSRVRRSGRMDYDYEEPKRILGKFGYQAPWGGTQASDVFQKTSGRSVYQAKDTLRDSHNSTPRLPPVSCCER